MLNTTILVAAFIIAAAIRPKFDCPLHLLVACILLVWWDLVRPVFVRGLGYPQPVVIEGQVTIAEKKGEGK